jgi:hypothetical protein
VKDYQGRRRDKDVWVVPDTVEELINPQPKTLPRNAFDIYLRRIFWIGCAAAVWALAWVLIFMLIDLATSAPTDTPTPSRSTMLCGTDLGGC